MNIIFGFILLGRTIFRSTKNGKVKLHIYCTWDLNLSGLYYQRLFMLFFGLCTYESGFSPEFLQLVVP